MRDPPLEQFQSVIGARSTRTLRSLPRQLVVGLTLLLVTWPTAWFGPAPFSEHTFFPLWLGYILTVDGVVLLRNGTSLFTRDRRRFLGLFLASIPLWWIFEAANDVLGNWTYVLPHDYQFVTYHALATLAFSTVVPALFETAELISTFGFIDRIGQWIAIAPSRTGLIAISAGGLVTTASVLIFPNVAFPLTWLGLFFLLDPINYLAGGQSVAGQVRTGNWRVVVVLFAAGIICGWFWEMWNYWSLPKWEYSVPVASEPRLFEMPLLGYGGYFPFALEVYAVYQTLCVIVRAPSSYLRFDRINPCNRVPAARADRR